MTDRTLLGTLFIAAHLSLLLQMSLLSLQHSSNSLGPRVWSPRMHTCRQLLNLS